MFNTYDVYYPLLDGEHMTVTAITMYDSQGVCKDQYSNAPFYLYAVYGDGSKTLLAEFDGLYYDILVGPYPDRCVGNTCCMVLYCIV